MPTLPQLDNEISEVEAELNRLRLQRNQIAADLQRALDQRPAGIPATWKPFYDGSGPGLRVYAWFDPTKFGDELRARIP